jgi:hypothetical protein
MAELEALIGRIAGTQLDRSEPLWELHVVDGLADGRVAVVAKMHHALADGLAANALLANVTDGGHGVGGPNRLEPTPTPARLALTGLLDAVRQLLLLPRLLLATLRSVVALLHLKPCGRRVRCSTPRARPSTGPSPHDGSSPRPPSRSTTSNASARPCRA